MEENINKSEGVGPMIAIIIILLIIIAGGLYFWLGQEANEYNPSANSDVSELEKDLETDELNQIDDELNSIDTEFEASGTTQ